MNEFMNIMELILFDNTIPVYVKQDVSKRVSDWCGAGHSLEHDYIKRQYEYLLRVKESRK